MAAENETVVEYAGPARVGTRRLVLEERNGEVRVIFPIMSAWVYALIIAMPILCGAMNAWDAIGTARFYFKTAAGSPAISSVVRSIFEFEVCATFFWLALGTWQWWSYRRWGHIPRVLIGSTEGLVLSRVLWWKVRQRKWPVQEIAGVEVIPLRINLNWTRTVATLFIHLKNGRRLRFQLSSADAELPGRIGREMARVLGCAEG